MVVVGMVVEDKLELVVPFEDMVVDLVEDIGVFAEDIVVVGLVEDIEEFADQVGDIVADQVEDTEALVQFVDMVERVVGIVEDQIVDFVGMAVVANFGSTVVEESEDRVVEGTAVDKTNFGKFDEQYNVIPVDIVEYLDKVEGSGLG